MDIGIINGWNDIAGNYRIKQHFQNMTRELKIRKSQIQRQNFLILGDSRGGKTSAVQWLIRCLHCQEICPVTLNPICGGKCDRCKAVDPRFGDAGLTSNLAGDCFQTNFINCMTLRSAHDVREIALSLEFGASPGLIVLDEVGRMAKNGWEEILLGTLETPNLHWLGTAISADSLDPAFKNRFNILRTEAASLADLCIWIQRRMKRHSITADSDETVMSLAKAARSTPGRIVNELRRVSMRNPRILTHDDVVEFSQR